MPPVHLRVFLSSPGDVVEERRWAREIIERLPRKPLLEGKVTLEAVAWDSPEAPVPLASGESPQDSVNRHKSPPGDCDLTVVILWSRMGSPLPDAKRKRDGTLYRSGTEWEYEDARANGSEVWVYQRTEVPTIKLLDAEQPEKKAQYETVLHFLAELRGEGGVNLYATVADFARDFEKHLEAFARDRIDAAPREPARPMGITTAPLLPASFVARSTELGELKRSLLTARSASDSPPMVALTTAFQGGGGFGKTTLAVALCHDPEVRDVFADAILWIELGEAPEVPRLLARQIELLTGRRSIITDERAGEEELRRALKGRAVLLVLDDVWNPAHARPFLQAGPRGAHLVTTRNQRVAVALEANSVAVNQMGGAEASALLAKLLKMDPANAALRHLAVLLGRWPLALKLAAGQLVDLTRNAALSLDQAIGRLGAALAARGVIALDAADEQSRHTSLAACIEVSLGRLGGYRERVLELGVFPEDIEIPFAAIDRLWRATSSTLTEPQIREARTRARHLSIFERYDEGNESLRLHDVVRTYLREQLGERRMAVNRAFLDEPSESFDGGDSQMTGYWQRYLGYHLVEAGLQAELRKRLFDVRILANKLAAADVNALFVDFDRLSLNSDEPLRLLKKAIQLSAHVLGPAPDQLLGQLRGRLLGNEHPELRAVAERCRERASAPAILPLWLSLAPPGGPLVRTFAGCMKAIGAPLVMSADGKTALWCSDSDTLKLWDLTSGRELCAFADRNRMKLLAIGADSKTALSDCFGTVQLWDLPSGRELRRFDGNKMKSAVMSPDGKRALSETERHALVLWDLASGRELRTLTAHTTSTRSLAMTADGKIALAGLTDLTVKVWDLASGSELHTFRGHESTIWSVAISADAKIGLSGSRDKTVIAWDLDSGRELNRFAHTAAVQLVAISADGKTALSASDDHMVKVWDLASGRELAALEGHTSAVLSLAISADGKTALSGSADEAVKLWDLSSSRAPRTFAGHAAAVLSVASADGQTVPARYHDTAAKLLDLASGRNIQAVARHTDAITCVAVSADGKKALSGSYDKAIKLWDVPSACELRTLAGHAKGVTSVAISADGKTALSGSMDKRLKLWDLASGREPRTFAGHAQMVRSVAMSADGKTALSGSDDRTLKVWDLISEREVRTLTGHTGAVWSVAMSADGKTALSGADDNTVKMWDLTSWQDLRTFSGHKDTVWAVAISADGKTVLSGSGDKMVRVWDLTSRREPRTLAGHGGPVWSVAISPDGKTALSGSNDNTVKLWDIISGRVLATFTGEAAFIATAYSASARVIAAGDGLGNLHLLEHLIG